MPPNSNNFSVYLVILSLLFAGASYYLSDVVVFKALAQEQTRIFPASGAGGWRNAQAAFSLDLKKKSEFKEFNATNSAFPDFSETIILGEKQYPAAFKKPGFFSTFLGGIRSLFGAEAIRAQTGESPPAETPAPVSSPSPVVSPDGGLPPSATPVPPSKIPQESVQVVKVLELSNFAFSENFQTKAIENVSLAVSLAAKGRAADTLTIDYLRQDFWQNLAEINLENEISNDANGGYFLYALPGFKSVKELKDLKVKFTLFSANGSSFGGPSVFLDAAWLEAQFAGELKETPTPEATPEATPIPKDVPLEKLAEKIASFFNPKASFGEDEEPRFTLVLPQSRMASGTPQVSIEETALTGPDSRTVAANIAVIGIGAETYRIKIGKPSNWQAGRYFLTVKIRRDGEIHQASVWFNWNETMPEKILRFFIDRLSIKSRNNLDWHPENFQNGIKKENDKINVRVADERRSSAIVFEGACQKEYFVILGYSQPEDYNKKPFSFIYNKAFPCQNGAYYYQLKDLPSRLEAGIYYFLVAEQGETGPWQPITAIQPVRIRAERTAPTPTPEPTPIPTETPTPTSIPTETPELTPIPTPASTETPTPTSIPTETPM